MERLAQPRRNDRARQIVDTAMFDREAKLGVVDACARSGSVGLDHDQPPIDLLPPVHPRGILLADEAALGEADAIQLGGVAFEPEQVAELGAAFANAETEAMLEPAACRIVRHAERALAEGRQTRVGRAVA